MIRVRTANRAGHTLRLTGFPIRRLYALQHGEVFAIATWNGARVMPGLREVSASGSEASFTRRSRHHNRSRRNQNRRNQHDRHG